MSWPVIVLVSLPLAVFVAGRAGLYSGSEPPDLGVRDGRLKPPSLTENSVSSQAGLYPDHPMRAHAEIAPFEYEGEPAAALDRLRRIVEASEGARVVRATPDYLYAQFETRWLRFVDDVEFLVDDERKLIHTRSASRIGAKDFGVNRARIEALRRRFRS